MENGTPVAVKVWGEFACFTRPEMKVERVSYPVMTPSAARGVLEAIFWKPEMQWRIRQIEVLKPVRWISILRNEVKSKASVVAAGRWERTGGGYFADEDRAQRHTLALRDVAYIIRADVAPRPHAADVDPAKYRDQFRRRVSAGKCHHTPYLGCREFAADFSEPDRADRPIDWTADLGPMLFDLDYLSDGTGRGTPRFFEARIEGGLLSVPAELYEEQEARHAR
jgi:CRISPR-associated protein Cas5d